MGDRHVTEASTCTTHHIHNRQISMLPAGSEHAIPGSKRPLTYALEVNFSLSLSLSPQYISEGLFYIYL